jgi:predicted nucleic acid-binding protein
MAKKPTNPKSSEAPKRFIILDTNIISAFSNDVLGAKMIQVLDKAVSYGYGLAISDYTYYELFNESSVEKEVKMNQTLQVFTRYFVKKSYLIGAAHLACLYKEEGIPMTQINDGDRIIASTAVLTGSLILTTNARDFPPPFFKEIAREVIEYENKGWPVFVPIYFMEPQGEYIDHLHNKRIEPLKKKGENAKRKDSKGTEPK